MAANGLVNCAYCQKYVLEATHLCLNEFAEKTGLFSIAEPPFLDFELETESLSRVISRMSKPWMIIITIIGLPAMLALLVWTA